MDLRLHPSQHYDDAMAAREEGKMQDVIAHALLGILRVEMARLEGDR